MPGSRTCPSFEKNHHSPLSHLLFLPSLLPLQASLLAQNLVQNVLTTASSTAPAPGGGAAAAEAAEGAAPQDE
jgi:hypothetical protein